MRPVVLVLLLAAACEEPPPCGTLNERPLVSDCPDYDVQHLCCEDPVPEGKGYSMCEALAVYKGTDYVHEVYCGEEEDCLDWMANCRAMDDVDGTTPVE